MIKNVTLKKVLIKGIFPFFSQLNKVIPKDYKTIFIYCANGDLSDNSEALFHFLVDNGYTEKYKIVCGADTPSDYKATRNPKVIFISKSKCILQYMKSKYVFYSMGKLPIKPTNKQCVINMWHGIPLKKIGKLSDINNGDEFFFTYVCASSELFRPIMAKAFGCPEENVCICGEQKQDNLFKPKKPSNQKLIVWTPTFRQSDYLGYNDSSEDAVLPLLKQTEWEGLNEYLNENNVKMIVKLHPLQNLNGINCKEYSNLQIMSDKIFKEKGMNLYSLLSQSDALISDYSSVYLEYLVVNRPICFAISDMEEYSDTRGFIFEEPRKYMPGWFAETKEELFRFIQSVASNSDPYKNKRESVRDLVHHYKDGNNCKRILEIADIEL